jgi:hypothetical protein
LASGFGDALAACARFGLAELAFGTVVPSAESEAAPPFFLPAGPDFTALLVFFSLTSASAVLFFGANSPPP